MFSIPTLIMGFYLGGGVRGLDSSFLGDLVSVFSYQEK